MTLLDRGAPHEPLTIVHSHPHSDGHGGVHSHSHVHKGDNWHTGGTHQAAPGSPDTDIPHVQLNSAAPGVYDLAAGFLGACGVDVGREMARVAREREYEAHRTREAADRIRDLALDLKRAESKLLFEARGFNEGCPGFTGTKLQEAQQHVTVLEGALDEACLHDRGLVRSARRAAG